MTFISKFHFVFLFSVMTLIIGCADGSTTNDLFGSDGNGDGSVAKNLDIAITSPSGSANRTGWSKKVSGTCGTAGVPITISGGASGYAICLGDGTWEVTVDTSEAAVGDLAVYAQMIDTDGVSGNVASVTLNKFSTLCDDEDVRDDTFANSTTTAAAPWIVCTSSQLANVSSVLTENVELHNDIDIAGGSFSSIGYRYEATFEGNSFKIFDINITNTSNSYGLFRRLRNTATIQNLYLEDMKVTADYWVGGLVGYIDAGSTVVIDNVHFTNLTVDSTHATNGHAGGILGGSANGATTVTIQNSSITNLTIDNGRYIGGMVGYIENGSGSFTITDSSISGGSITAVDYSGGIIGRTREASTTVARVTNSANVSASGQYIGGITGYSEGGTYTDVVMTGNVSSASNTVGGLVGYMTQSAGSIQGTSAAATRSGAPSSAPPTTSACYSTGTVQGRNNVGGIVGYNNGDTLSSCYATGNITGSGNGTGGLVGYQVGNDVTDSFATGTIIGGDLYTGGLIGYFHSNGQRVEDSYATGNVTGTSIAPNYIGGLVGYFNGSVQVDDSWATGNVEALANLEDLGTWDANTNNPSLSDGSGSNGDWYTVSVAGTTSLDGHATWNIGDYVQFDGIVGTWERNNASSYVGGLLGIQENASAVVTDSYSTGTVTVTNTMTALNHDRIGGFIGDSDGGLSNCYATGDVTADNGRYVGGLVGVQDGTANSITSCYATGNVSTTKDYAGGLVASNSANNITSSYATGSVTGGNYVGGLIGNTGGDFVNNCYAQGAVSGDDAYIGGLMGHSSTGSQELNNSYATGNVTATGTSPQYVAGLVGYARQTVQFDTVYATGNVTVPNADDSATVRYIGGLFGHQERTSPTINDAYATGNVTVTIPSDGVGHYYVGGFAGYSRVPCTDCYATGDVSATMVQRVGGFVGYMDRAVTYTRVYATGSVQGGGPYVGGLVGWWNNNGGVVTDSYATGDVTASRTNADYTGGLIGCSRADIFNSYTTGDVTGVRHYVGGIEGGCTNNDDRYITGSFATGNVTHTNLTGIRVGGITGYMNTSVDRLVDNFTTGNVSCGGGECGGIIGYMVGDAANSMRRNYATGTVSRLAGGGGADNRYGPLLGRVNATDRIESTTNFYNTDFPVLDETATAMGGSEYLTNQNGLSSAQMQVQGNFTSFDFGTPVWEMPSGTYVLPGTTGVYTYPILEWQE